MWAVIPRERERERERFLRRPSRELKDSLLAMKDASNNLAIKNSIIEISYPSLPIIFTQTNFHCLNWVSLAYGTLL